MDTFKMPRKKYKFGHCLFCGSPIKKPGRLWCLATHRKKHDQRLKANPVKYADVICRTADQLETAICDSQRQIKLSHKQFEAFEKSIFQGLYDEEKAKPANEQDKARMTVLKRYL